MAKHEAGMGEDSKITTKASPFQSYSYCRGREHVVYIIKTLCYPLAQRNSGFCLPRRSLKEEDLGLDLLAALLFSLGE